MPTSTLYTGRPRVDYPDSADTASTDARTSLQGHSRSRFPSDTTPTRARDSACTRRHLVRGKTSMTVAQVEKSQVITCLDESTVTKSVATGRCINNRL